MDKEQQRGDTRSDGRRPRISAKESQNDELHQYIDQLTTLNAKLAPDGTILMINATAAAVSGARPSELVDRKLWELPELGRAAEKQDALRSVVSEAALGKLVRVEIIHPTASGSCMTLDLSVKPVVDASGVVAYLLAEGRDTSQRKLVEEALKESEDKYRTLFESANDAIVLMDYDRFTGCNKTIMLTVLRFRELRAGEGFRIRIGVQQNASLGTLLNVTRRTSGRVGKRD